MLLLCLYKIRPSLYVSKHKFLKIIITEEKTRKGMGVTLTNYSSPLLFSPKRFRP